MNTLYHLTLTYHPSQGAARPGLVLGVLGGHLGESLACLQLFHCLQTSKNVIRGHLKGQSIAKMKVDIFKATTN